MLRVRHARIECFQISMSITWPTVFSRRFLYASEACLAVRCLVPMPRYYARPMRFGYVRMRALTEKGLERRRTGTRQGCSDVLGEFWLSPEFNIILCGFFLSPNWHKLSEPARNLRKWSSCAFIGRSFNTEIFRSHRCYINNILKI